MYQNCEGRDAFLPLDTEYHQSNEQPSPIDKALKARHESARHPIFREFKKNRLSRNRRVKFESNEIEVQKRQDRHDLVQNVFAKYNPARDSVISDAYIVAGRDVVFECLAYVL